jgi:hypothetical protein
LVDRLVQDRAPHRVNLHHHSGSAPADGYTLLSVGSSVAINATLYETLS